MRTVEISTTDIAVIKNFLNTNKRLETIKYIRGIHEFGLRDVNSMIKKASENQELKNIKIYTGSIFNNTISRNSHILRHLKFILSCIFFF